MQTAPPNTMYGTTTGFYPAADTIPLSTAMTGTLDSAGPTVTGTTTVFLTELQVGDYIYVPATKELRKVIQINSDTLLMVDSAFAAPLVAEPFSATRPMFKQVGIWNIGGADASINGEKVLDGQYIPLPAIMGSGGIPAVPVFMYDEGGSELAFSTI